VSILQTVLLYGAVPVALYLLIALLAAGRGLSRRPRYRPGDQWRYPSSWWSANPEGSGLPEPSTGGEHDEHPDDAKSDAVSADASRGGAHGSW
jgi:hypothetical protein